MEICSFSRQFPAINLRFNQTPTFHPTTVRCSIISPRNAQSSAQLSIDGEMFILGMGFVGKFFAADLKKNGGWVVSGSCTSIVKKKKLEELGDHAYVFDANDPQAEILEIIKDHTHLVVSTPPIVGFGDPMLQHKELVESILKDGKLRWIAYLSSTSVYGHSAGAWVDEHYPANPVAEHARARLAAEEEWLSLGHNLGISTQVFRLGGIYGPGRSAVDTILKQEPLSKSQKTRSSKNYTSRAHVADVSQALHASILNPSSGQIYNIVDDDPAPRANVFKFAQKLIVEKFPNHGKLNMALSEAESIIIEKGPKAEKRVSNTRMKKELGVKLLHPTYRSGLRSIIEHMDSSLL